MRVRRTMFSLSPFCQRISGCQEAALRLREQGSAEPRSQTITWISRNSAVSEGPSKMLAANSSEIRCIRTKGRIFRRLEQGRRR